MRYGGKVRRIMTMIWKMEIERGAEVMREAIKTFNGLIVIDLLARNKTPYHRHWCAERVCNWPRREDDIIQYAILNNSTLIMSRAHDVLHLMWLFIDYFSPSLVSHHVIQGRDATPYLERNRVGRDAIDSAAALTDMGKYLFRERRLPVYDIAVAITKYVNLLQILFNFCVFRFLCCCVCSAFSRISLQLSVCYFMIFTHLINLCVIPAVIQFRAATASKRRTTFFSKWT